MRYLVSVALFATLIACDQRGSSAEPSAWESDSVRLASSEGVLLRAIEHEQGRAVVPIALLGPHGLRRIQLSDRGWRAFDSLYLHQGRVLQLLPSGKPIRLLRGMWESGAALDSLPGCRRIVPAGLADVPRDADLLVAGKLSSPSATAPLPPSTLTEVLAFLPTLVAPTRGITPNQLARYERSVRVLETHSTPTATIVVTYDDPEPVADSLRPETQRPRHLVVVLDRGSYGYRPTHVFSTLGNLQSAPRRRLLGHVDIDGDGKAELLFAAKRGGTHESTIILRFGRDEQWTEVLNELVRCQL